MESPHSSDEIRRLKWIFGTAYTVEGSNALSDIPTLFFIKYALGMGDAGGQLFQSVKSTGWLLKPLWGFISDRFPIFGYHRKSWFVLMAGLGFVFWAAIGFFAFLRIRTPIVYLIGFNLVSITYAFVDVVSDALMVEHGRRLKRVGYFVNFEWTLLALSNAAVAFVSGWFEEQILHGDLAYWMIFMATGIFPLATVCVGIMNIPEKKGTQTRIAKSPTSTKPPSPESARRDDVMVFLVLFIFMWNFSPSIGYIERSYLIDVRGFSPTVFGTVFTLQALTFLVSIVAYRGFLRLWPAIAWHQYLYAMVGIMVVAFPLSFYLYLNPNHPWWNWLTTIFSLFSNPVPGWNRYVWFRIVFSVLFGFATIPAFIIPLRIAGETVEVESAGMSYAFLMALTNVTNVIEGVIGSGLYWLLTQPKLSWLVVAFRESLFNIAATSDKRTLILQLFVYISLAFTLLTVPFIELLRRALDRHGIVIKDQP